ncbi:jg22323, partial [Pararge aegeria aegeria]
LTVALGRSSKGYGTNDDEGSETLNMSTADQNTVVTIPPYFRGCRTRRLREYNGKRVAASSVLLLPCSGVHRGYAQDMQMI